MQEEEEEEEERGAPHCVICAEANPEQQWHVLDCTHGFHTGCIMQWFRQGGSECPLCRRESGEGDGLFMMDIMARASFLRQKSRCKSAPKDLVRIVKSLQKKEEKDRAARKEYRAFRRISREFFKEERRLRNKKWRTWQQVRMQKRKLGLYSNADFPVPLVIRKRRRSRLF